MKRRSVLDWGYENQGKFWLIVGPPWAIFVFLVSRWIFRSFGL
jgi:hypothetical protein